MNKYVLSFAVNNDILNIVSNIMLKLGKLDNYATYEENKVFILLKNINPYNEQDLLKIQSYSSRVKNIQMKSLFSYLNSKKEYIHPIILATIFLYNFATIKPYTNKNDILAKTWFKLLLTDYNRLFAYIPIEKNINLDNIYSEDLNTFTKNILNIINKLLDNLFNNNDLDVISININKLLDAMPKNKPMTAYEIMDKLNIRSKETFRNSYLNYAIEKGKVSLTIPDKPTSRNQMYYRI